MPAVETTNGQVATPRWPGHVRVAIIGAGFGGLGAGARLAAAGISDFVILERAETVGGTWRDNTYPGCACDVPSHLYSFSFAPNPEWSHNYSRQPEILDYLKGVADRFGLRRHLWCRAEVTEARWDAEDGCWRLQTGRGPIAADVVIAATGPLSAPKVPAISGLEQFPGAVFHSARWDHSSSLTGMRVAVIGTGASAVQIVPAIQPQVGRLVLFQRTPAWVVPRGDREISATRRWLYRHSPLAQRLSRFSIYATREATAPAFTRWPELLKGAQRVALRNLAQGVADPALRAKLTPHYVMGCKRILLSDDFYPALSQPNVEVVASGLARIEGSTLIADDGSAHDVDAVILATGFRTIDLPIAERVFGAGGRSLAETWGGDLRALRGTTIAGFPNLCLVIGPNTGVGHTSMIHIIESQVAYIVDYLKTLDRRGLGGLDARPEAQDRWCRDVERRMAATVWATGGCQSWYLNRAGRNPTLWPATTIRFRHRTRRVEIGEYHEMGVRNMEKEALPAITMRVPSTDGVSLHAEIRGPADAPTVVLVHGWTNTSRVWDRVVDALGDDLRIVTYDQRGHGASDVPPKGSYSCAALVDDLSAVLDATLPPGRQAVLVGHSMGGMTVMAAGSRPSVVGRSAGVVLASTGFSDLAANALVVPVLWRSAAAATQRFLLCSAAPLGPANPISRAALRYATLGKGTSKEVAVFNAKMVHACGRRTRGEWGRVMNALDVGGDLAGWQVPVHVLVGSADRMTPPVQAHRIVERLPRPLGVTEVPGVGHMTPLESPEVIARLARSLVPPVPAPVAPVAPGKRRY
jgi:cation diffusion facilitator CzcD-associated flavoprotein CzcO/pimeloyl-ACP methyl ester carboxylesterase